MKKNPDEKEHLKKLESARKAEIKRQEQRRKKGGQGETQEGGIFPEPTAVDYASSNVGEVFVHAYDRRTGKVESHTRTKADGDASNNRSFRK